MEGVEDIPGTALTEGIDWSWETFPEYLDALDAPPVRRSTSACRCRTVPCAAYVMGERGAANEPATPDEIAAMAAIVQEAVEAGALGFSTSRTLGHRAMDGEPVPGTFAAEDELFALGRAMKAGGRAVFELAPLGASGEDLLAPEQEMDWMVKLSDELGLPVSFTLLQIDAAPDAVARAHGRVARARTTRARRSCPQVAGAPVRHAARLPDPPRFQRSTHLPGTGGAPLARRAVRRVGEAVGAGPDPRRGRCRPGSDGAVRRHVPARAGFARSAVRAG